MVKEIVELLYKKKNMILEHQNEIQNLQMAHDSQEYKSLFTNCNLLRQYCENLSKMSKILSKCNWKDYQVTKRNLYNKKVIYKGDEIELKEVMELRETQKLEMKALTEKHMLAIKDFNDKLKVTIKNSKEKELLEKKEIIEKKKMQGKSKPEKKSKWETRRKNQNKSKLLKMFYYIIFF
jgi:sialic acid synthase SpsE